MITSMVGLKMITYTKISPKMVNPIEIAGNAEEEELNKDLQISNSLSLLIKAY